jgi:plastocyanin domain-containing protein
VVDAPVAAQVEGGVQTVAVEVGMMGYAPSAVALQPGVPAELVVTRTADNACAAQLQIPAYDVPPTDLPLGEPVTLAFTPDEEGTFEFVCGMNMMRGSIVVQPAG